jgi:glutamate synthase (NADPH/NADH) large chain
VHHAGTPWELGLAETQQILVGNGLRSRVRVQVDGQLKTGRDVAFAALLGAEEFGFATAPLIASGCVMMRKCHLNTCPVGIATQDPVLRARFRGTPEHVVRYFFYVAEELRAIMARLGFRTVDEMVGRVEHIVPKTLTTNGLGADKARALDFTDVLRSPDEEGPRRCTTKQTPVQPSDLDERILDEARLSLKYREPTTMRVAVTNADRAFGSRLAGEIARTYGELGLPDGTITIEATGTAGQSFGAFAAKGMLVVLEGDANDYVGKGLSGGIIAALPPRRSTFRACDNVIVGNTVLYGATSGKAFFAGRGGERFAVRNSGATVVVEGVGDHACEYMTGGVVVVLGSAGRNFAAGMSGGVAYVFDPSGDLALNKATELESAPLDTADVEIVRGLVEEHVQYTRSTRGAALLADFTAAQRRFVRVVPLEYKRALAKSKGAA